MKFLKLLEKWEDRPSYWNNKIIFYSKDDGNIRVMNPTD